MTKNWDRKRADFQAKIELLAAEGKIGRTQYVNLYEITWGIGEATSIERNRALVKKFTNSLNKCLCGGNNEKAKQ